MTRKRRPLSKSDLLNHLWRYQLKHGFITDDDAAECATKFKLSSIDLEGVISFYHFFHRQSAGQFRIYLNNSIVSEFKGYARVREAFERETGGVFGGVDPSGMFGLFETPCIGLSDQEPAALINFHPFTNLNTLKVKRIITRLKRGETPKSICDVVQDNIKRIPGDKAIIFRDYHPGACLAQLKNHTAASILKALKKSQLRGMGGAFFPTGLKWELCAKQTASPKYIICNADEGEPGTFKDRVLINRLSGLLLEGMAVAGYAVKAQEGIIYLRAEYRWLKDKLEETIAHFYKMNLLGKSIVGIKDFDFDLRVQVGAGSYVCGEETALLNSLEGKRGEPRTKQCFPTERGYLQKPTVVNNVETFCMAARVIELGADHFLQSGTKASPGTKLISVSGDCKRPGIYEIEWGTTVAEILNYCRADDPHYMQVSGPAGECISLKEINRTIEKDDLRCGGSFMAFNSKRDILTILSNFTRFFKHESCGICTPCRAGNFIIQRKLQKIASKLAYQSDFQELREWGKIMQLTSRCGLGKTASRSLLMALDKFPEYFDSKVDHHKEGLNKEFDLVRATREYEMFES